MKAIVNTAPGVLEILDLETPEPGPGEVRIRTAVVGICATDLQMIGGWERTGFGAIPGHEWSGVVDKTGPGVSGGLVGSACVGENILRDGGEIGFEHPGGYGEYFITEAANLHVLPPDFPLDVAALIEPLAVCVRGLGRLRLEDTAVALVLGDGPIGLIMLMLLKRAGVERVYLAGGRPERLKLAGRLGAAATIDYHAAGANLARAIRAAVPDNGLRNIVEASGSAAAMAAALEVAARGARILVLGDYGKGTADFHWNRLLHGEWELIGSNASAGAWPEALKIAREPGFSLGRLVTHRLPAARFREAVDLVRTRHSGAVKVVLLWDSRAASGEVARSIGDTAGRSRGRPGRELQ